MFSTRVNVYFQGNRKCSFLPGCACLYLYSFTLSCALKLSDDDDDDDDDDEQFRQSAKPKIMIEE